jgi:hypothetical protein
MRVRFRRIDLCLSVLVLSGVASAAGVQMVRHQRIRVSMAHAMLALAPRDQLHVLLVCLAIQQTEPVCHRMAVLLLDRRK